MERRKIIRQTSSWSTDDDVSKANLKPDLMAIRVEPELENRQSGLKIRQRFGEVKEVALPREGTAPKGHAHVQPSSRHTVVT